MWNRLPVNLRCSEPITRFRSLIDDFLSESELCHLLNVIAFNTDLYKQGSPTIQLTEKQSIIFGTSLFYFFLFILISEVCLCLLPMIIVVIIIMNDPSTH